MSKRTPADFHIVGFIGFDQVSAQFKGGYLTADPELLDRADDLVRAGTTFELSPEAPPIPADLGEPLPAALTLTRCFDRITKAETVITGLEEFWSAFGLCGPQVVVRSGS
jgi:hypothetical protein